jgi:Secretion system C-terminal sorting domain
MKAYLPKRIKINQINVKLKISIMRNYLTILALLTFVQITISQNEKILRIPASEKTELDQINPITPGGHFDLVFDHFGNKYLLEDLKNKDNTNGKPKAAFIGCSSGYFDLYFEPGSGMETIGDPLHDARRAVLCQVFSDISDFINSPLSSPGNTTKVNILIRSISSYSTSNPGALGLASSFYSGPINIDPLNSAIIDNHIWKTINSGVDSYTNVTYPIYSSYVNGASYGFYHGLMAFDFNYVWNLDISQPLCPANQYDLYSVALHEIVHALGFASLLSPSGTSQFGAYFNYYSRYDMFLKNNDESLNLITNSGTCSMYGYQFNTTLGMNAITPGYCLGSGSNNTSCVDAAVYSGSSSVPVYTPTCFENGSSLSHFEDQLYPSCPSNYGNDAYFAMSNAIIPGGVNGTKRYLRSEERDVLCDLGYSVNNSYGIFPNSYTYSSGSCAGIGIVGVNDGIINSGFVHQTLSGVAYFFTGLDILSNDVNTQNPGSINFECLTDLTDPGATIPVSSGNSLSSISFTSSISGVHILSYVPINGNVKGNITYLYIYVGEPSCVPSVCGGLINNSGFEEKTGCSGLFPDVISFPWTGLTSVNCWKSLTRYPTIISSCTNPSGVYTNNAGFTFPNFFLPNTWDNSPLNENYLSLVYGDYWLGTEYIDVAAQQLLNTNVSPGISYTLSFRALNNVNNHIDYLNIRFSEFLIPYNPGNVTDVGGLPNIIDVGIPPIEITSDSWNYYSVTFNYNGPLNLNNIILYPSSDMPPFDFYNPEMFTYIWLDEVVLKESQTLSLPPSICVNQPIPDLMDFIGGLPPNGTFFGNGVVNIGGVFSFAPTTGGVYEINYTYTDILGCNQTLAANINVIDLITPTFNAFGPYCYGQTIPPLPTTSLNGVSGTWSPAINNAATTTYTFTPSAGLCASTVTTTIAPAGCQPVNNLAAASVTYNSGVVSWSPGCDETLWDVIFGTSPATTGTITYQNQISQTVSLANLSPSTTYYVHVRAECGPGVNSVWTTISFTTAPINDVICNALTIKPSSGTALNTYNAWTTNINCSNRTGNSTFATATGTPEVSCGGTNGRSLWYKFTTPSCVVGGVVPFAIEVSTDNAGTSFNTKIELFSSSDGTCNGILTPIVCNDDDESVINNCGGTSLLTSTIAQSLAPNTTYFVLLDGYNGEGGALEISGRALTDPPVVTAVSNTQFTVTTANVGAELYTYLARIVGSSGYSIGSSTNTSASFNMGNGATYETYIRYRCETNNQSQWYNTPEATITLPYSEACDPVIDLNCELSAPGSYTLTWTGLPGLYTANGTLTGYQLYYRVIGSTGYNFISNLSVTCNGTSCTRTINGLNNPIGYEFWLKTRCSPTWTVQSNTAVCALGAKGLGDDLFSFTNPQTGDEYHDVKFSDKWGDFGLDLNETGEYYIGINEKNEIYAEKISQNNSIGIEEEISFELIPNPTKNATTMVFNKSINHGTYKVIDALGRIVLEGEVSDTERVELIAAGWKNGVYHVQLTSKDKTVNRKLVVTK